MQVEGKRWRVAMVIGQYAPVVGGAEVQAQRLAGELARRGHAVQVLTGRWHGTWPADEMMDGVRVRRLGALRGGLGVPGLRRFGRAWFLRGLRRALARLQEQVDVIHAHQLLEPAVAAVAAGGATGTPVIAKMSSAGVTGDPEVLMARSGRGAWRRLCAGLTRLVAVSAACEREALEAGFPVERIARIPNGVPWPKWRKPEYSGDRRIVCVGRCRREKGLDVLVRAFGQLGRSLGGLRLDVVGGGEELQSLDILARTSGLGEAVTFHGDVADVTRFLKEADLFVLPSRTEGMSNALLEAMAAGLPCVATAAGGTAEVIEDGETGLLCAADSPTDLAAAMKRALVDESLRAKIGASARAKVEREYTMEKVAARYEALYGQVARAT